MNLTDSQRAAIEHRGSNLLVAASAGSGKTEVLARRCAALIADPGARCGIDRLLVVTFTRAAAAELRVRIAAMLRRAAAEIDDPRLREHVRRQELLIDTADIGTIDAWCGRLVREHFEAAGVDPGFSVLGADEAGLLRAEVAARLFEEVYGNARLDEEWQAANSREVRRWLQRVVRPNDEFLRQAVLKLHSFRDHLVDPQAWFDRQLEIASGSAERVLEEAEATLRVAVLGEVEFQTSELGGLDTAGASKFVLGQVGAYRKALEQWRTMLREARSVVEVGRLIDGFVFERMVNAGPADKRVRDEVKEKWWQKRLRNRWGANRIEGVLANAPRAAELVRTLLNLEARYERMLREEKARRGAYEFADVLRMALELLGEKRASRNAARARRAEGNTETASCLSPTGVARGLRERYEHVLVDEYQDTSPVQVELLRLVSRDASGVTNRFLVGDVKQSIYGFREAEPRLFVELARGMDDGRIEGRVQPLTDNFRSHAGVLDPLNAIFEKLFDSALGGTAYGERERLMARRDELPNAELDGSPRVELHIVEEHDDDAPTRAAATEEEREEDDNEPNRQLERDEEMPLERIEREAIVAAGCIRELLDARTQVLERVRDQPPCLRPMRLDDIVILLRSAAGNAALLAAKLREAGVPSVAIGRESLLDCLEVRDLRNVLTLLVNRRQELALAAYLRGPLGGLSAEDLLAIRQHSHERDFSAAVRSYLSNADDAERHTRLVRAMGWLDEWENAARDAALPDVLRRIVQNGAMKLFGQALPGGEHRVAMIESFEALSAEFAGGGGGVADFVDYLDSLEEQNQPLSAAAATGGDVVRIMTVHASKGLEFPVVLLMNAGAEFSRRRRDRGLQCDERYGIGLRFFDYPAAADLETAARSVIARQSDQRDLEEELRLLYVAATRAREKLLVVGHWRAGKWEECRAITPAGRPVSLIRRFNAAHTVEWVAMAVAASGVAGRSVRAVVHRADEVHLRRETSRAHISPRSREAAHRLVVSPQSRGTGLAGAPAETMAALNSDDEEWVREAVALLSASPDMALAGTPALLSVSQAKQSLAAGDEREARPRRVVEAPLPRPRFVETEMPADARQLGTATHRFLMLANLSRIENAAQVKAQLDELVAASRITAADATLVPTADIAWFASTQTARCLTAARIVRREVPFLYGVPFGSSDERVLLRGVIDCLVESEEGLAILDYKTDRTRNDKERRERVEGYSAQLGLYALAAAELFGRPVVRADLVFLRERQVFGVDVTVERLAKLREDVGRIAPRVK